MGEREEKLRILSDWIDGDLDPEEARQLEETLKRDEDLRRIADDFAALKKAAKTPIPAGSEDLYARLQAGVDRRYGRRFRRIFRPQFGYGLGLLAGAVMVLLWVFRPASDDVSLASAQRQMAQAQQQYRLAIEDMERVSLAKLESMPPDVATVYQKNLDIIDQAIAECERWAQNHPEYVAAYRDLRRVYDAKVELLKQILQG